LKPYHITYYDPKFGKVSKRGFRNKIIEIIISDPSPQYQEEFLEPAHKEYLRWQADVDRKILVQHKLIEMAEKELKKEGKL